MEKKKVVLITGASSGIGRACAQRLSVNGCHVFGTSRQVRLPLFDGESRYQILPLDVCSENGAATVASVVKAAGRIDVLINNAGSGIAGPLEDTSIEDIKAQLEVNFYGMLRMCQAVIPTMRQEGGLIINISSIGGILSLPFQGAYSVSKFAIEAATRAMRMELRGSGIKFVLVRPGDCSTGFTGRRRKIPANQISQTYKESYACAIGVIEKNERAGMQPDKVAQVVEKIIKSPSPKASYVVGSCEEKAAIILQKVLPARFDGFFDKLLMGFYNIPTKREMKAGVAAAVQGASTY